MVPLAPWYWRSRPLGNRRGSDIFHALFQHQLVNYSSWRSIATLLESPSLSDCSDLNQSQQSSLSQYSICAGAPRLVDGKPQIWTPTLGSIFPTLHEFLARTQGITLSCPTALPFTGGWLGWLGYDAAWEIEQLPNYNRDPLPFPVAFWYVPNCFAVLDHDEQTIWLAATYSNHLDEMEAAIEAIPSLPIPKNETQSSLGSSSPSLLSPIQFVSNQDDYERMVVQAKKHIQVGDIFQANLSLRFSSHVQADSWSIYRALQTLNPSPFSSYWHTPWGAVISCSPERLIQRQGAIAQTRPIAGTRPRGSTPDHDQTLAQELLDNTKENAEHIMLVDLERNDLGRVCDWGSVHVNELLTVERYSHVMHLVSNVKGTVRSHDTSIDLIRALFPGGTITGCPKVRCMEIIEALEPVRRSLFYGSCGYLDWRGDLDLNILIRTLLYVPTTILKPRQRNSSKQLANHQELGIVWGQIGAGIVADSNPEREWYESLSKAQAQLNALEQAHRFL